MRRKYKLTWFARFTIFMICLTPFCYLGVTQYQNNAGVKEIVDNVINKIKSKTKAIKIELDEDNSNMDELKNDIKTLKAEIESLEAVIESKKNELNTLENQSGEV